MTTATPPIGPRGIAARAVIEGRTAGLAGDALTSCPYDRAQPFTRRAWLVGYVIGRRKARLPLPTDVEAAHDHDDTPPQAP